MRRVQGRFTTNSASEAFQRQLSAPVHKWKKAWVTPNGLQPESSYKICKWVRVETTADDDMSPGPDGDEDEEGDEDMDEDEADEGEEEGDGEAEAEEGKDAPPTEPVTEAATPVPAAEAEASTSDVDIAPPPSIEPTEPAPSATTGNAVEMTNAPAVHTEEGQADLGKGEGGVEMHAATAVPSDTVAVVDEEKQPGTDEMEVDVPLEAGVIGDETKGQDQEQQAEAEAEVVPLEVDEGLVHGEMEPPNVEMAVTGEESGVVKEVEE